MESVTKRPINPEARERLMVKDDQENVRIPPVASSAPRARAVMPLLRTASFIVGIVAASGVALFVASWLGPENANSAQLGDPPPKVPEPPKTAKRPALFR